MRCRLLRPKQQMKAPLSSKPRMWRPDSNTVACEQTSAGKTSETSEITALERRRLLIRTCFQ